MYVQQHMYTQQHTMAGSPVFVPLLPIFDIFISQYTYGVSIHSFLLNESREAGDPSTINSCIAQLVRPAI